MSPLLTAQGLAKAYPLSTGPWARRRELWAVRGVDLEVGRGEVVALVGESGSGKSTLGRLVLALEPPTAGRVCFDGVDLASLSPPALRALRRRMQIVFQDPGGALNPRMRVERALAEPLEVHAVVPPAERPAEVRRLLARVGLPAELAWRYPHELSGGQRQRVVIARALALRPELLVADEPTSALDVSVRAQILNLLAEQVASHSLSLLFISHDLGLVQHFADRVYVLYAGRVVESLPAAALSAARHPYTQALLAAQPSLGGDALLPVLAGEPPSAVEPPAGCAFRARCPWAVARCAEQVPPLTLRGPGHAVACPEVE